MMRIMMIAGEASGDLHGAGVVRELKRKHPEAEIYGIGGDKMRAEGMQLIYHVNEVSIMGFVEVLRHLPLLRSIARTLETILSMRRPDVLVLIDYPGFNLRFARKAKSRKIPILYYIGPQVWAWHPGRLKKMRGLIDKMLVIFPFEVELYRRQGIDVEFVGHPLLETLEKPQTPEQFRTRYGFDNDRPIVGLFPGSRVQELKKIFPEMLAAALRLHREIGAQLAVGVASVLAMEFVKSFVREELPVKLVQHATRDLMANADVALVTSGTATLETAYYQTPMVIVYKTSWLSYLVARLLIRIKHIGLVNIVAGRTIVPELVQHKATAQRMAEEAARFLTDEKLAEEMRRKLAEIRERLGTAGASQRVAGAILELANASRSAA